MSRYGRDPDTIRQQIAYAVGNDLDILGNLRDQHEQRFD